jgi:hypothetical protein
MKSTFWMRKIRKIKIFSNGSAKDRKLALTFRRPEFSFKF